MKRKTTASFRALTCAAAAAALSAAVADTIPFWGDETPATNRTAAAVVTSTTSESFDSRHYSYQDFYLDSFTSMPTGLILLIR